MEGLSEFKQLQPSGIVAELITLIDEHLPNFTESEEFVRILEKKKNENQHSLSFCVFMTNKCHSRFYFGRENAQLGNSVIDIGVYHGSILIFTIEAKLLPTPIGNKKEPRQEHEYVYGKGAGIQRFKDGKHGLDNVNNPLDRNGMIAFIKENDFDFWLQRVNEWVLEVRWAGSEQLEKLHFNSTAQLKSKHSRSDGTEVTLYHFWTNVS